MFVLKTCSGTSKFDSDSADLPFLTKEEKKFTENEKLLLKYFLKVSEATLDVRVQEVDLRFINLKKCIFNNDQASSTAKKDAEATVEQK